MADTDPTPPAPAPEPAPTPAPAETRPTWADELMSKLDAIKTGITEEDHERIGESTYKFFERGGAFEKPGDNPPKPGDKPVTPEDNPPGDRKVPFIKRIASYFE